MRAVVGAKLWFGSDDQAGDPERYPRFSSQVASFCLDRSEVVVQAYRECVASGACTAAGKTGRFCNERFSDRASHPVNCVDWEQATRYCASRGRRLPGELEFEFALRGGEANHTYSWGNEPPDGRTCWKHPGGSCVEGSYPPGAYDLVDMTGNVWEWTSDWYGPYPWPADRGSARVYRGGSWSRRFEKWLKPGLRSRERPGASGSHLGFRCALTLPGTACPYGKLDDGSCRRGVDEVHCSPGTAWNGVRCARHGEPRCGAGTIEKEGHGCVLAIDVAGPLEVETTPVTRVRTPQFDPDCAAHYPGKPSAYRYSGGSHAGRNRTSGGAGCKNRDVGVGWNSTCCP